MKKSIVISILLILILTFAACTQEKPIAENEVVDPSPKTDSKEVILYFVNKEYVETGDEELDKLVAEKRIVEYGDISLEESIVRELMAGPENADELYTGIPSTAKLIGVEVADGTAFINFAKEGLYGGSLQETFTINQIVSSLLELDNIKRVQFLIDGKKSDSLMGHYSIEEPFEDIVN